MSKLRPTDARDETSDHESGSGRDATDEHCLQRSPEHRHAGEAGFDRAEDQQRHERHRAPHPHGVLERAAFHVVTDVLVHGDALAGDRALVQCGTAAEDYAVGREALARNASSVTVSSVPSLRGM